MDLRKTANPFNINNIRLTNSSISSTSKNPEEEDANLLKNIAYDFIEIEARKYEKEREVRDKKMHFKKLIDLSLKSKNNIQKD